MSDKERAEMIPTMIGRFPQYPDCEFAVDCGIEGEMGLLDLEDGSQVRMLSCKHPEGTGACAFNFMRGRKCPNGKNP